MTDAHKNFIEMEADTLPDTNVFYATIIATLNEQLKEANGVITSYIRNNPLEKYGPAEAYCERWGVK